MDYYGETCKHQQHVVFGWVIHQNTFADGDTQFYGFYRNDVRMEKSDHFTMWVRGERIWNNAPDTLTDPFILAQRGNYVDKVDFAGRVFPRGVYTVKAVGEAENWCITSIYNDNKSPELQGTWLKPDETYQATKGDLLLIAIGNTSAGLGPIAIEVTSESLPIVAQTDTAIIKFSHRKA